MSAAQRHSELNKLRSNPAQVLMIPPDELLPWPAGPLAPIAAPRDVRPPGDLSLASATKRILDGECRCPIVVLETQCSFIIVACKSEDTRGLPADPSLSAAKRLLDGRATWFAGSPR